MLFLQHLFRFDGKELSIVAHPIPVPHLFFHASVFQPGFGVFRLRSQTDRGAQQFFCQAEGQLMPHAVTQGQIDRHKTRCRKAAEQVLFFQQQDLRAVTGRSQCCSDPCYAAPATTASNVPVIGVCSSSFSISIRMPLRFFFSAHSDQPHGTMRIVRIQAGREQRFWQRFRTGRAFSFPYREPFCFSLRIYL